MISLVAYCRQHRHWHNGFEPHYGQDVPLHRTEIETRRPCIVNHMPSAAAAAAASDVGILVLSAWLLMGRLAAGRGASGRLLLLSLLLAV